MLGKAGDLCLIEELVDVLKDGGGRRIKLWKDTQRLHIDRKRRYCHEWDASDKVVHRDGQGAIVCEEGLEKEDEKVTHVLTATGPRVKV